MKQTKQSERLWLMAMPILLAAALMSCAPSAKPIVYLQGTSQTLPLKSGQPAPFDGWLLSNEAMADLIGVH